ncbi:YjgN family protein [Pulveribacter sp.]|uniref:YjgN family protein n=1 Tax=Pulveribacter sp. TaxID=2678893 RepID=UPI0028ADE808|nr:YjgN family protein [Pulveribacter sp.]
MDAQTLGGGGALRASFASHDIEAHPLRFTGSGGGYFRVWIVNVLLSILTLGLYTPWARRRTAQYFYGHSLVAGSALEFTAQQRRMVVGFIAVALLTLAYKLAAQTGQDLALGLLLLGGALLSPLIWGSAMRFRLGNTRWRGVRLAFNASWREVYVASWPVFALALVVLAVGGGLQLLAPEVPPAEERRLPAFTAPMGGLIALGLVLAVLCVIRLEYNYRSLMVRRASIGQEAGRLKLRYRDFVWLWLATLAVFIVSVLVLSTLLAAVLGGSWALLKALVPARPGMGAVLLIVAAMVLGLLLLALATAPARAYREAALFRLTWGHTGVSGIARFKCNLRVGGFVLLRLRNALFTLLTLGLYRPFARVSEYRMKLQSVTVHVKGGVDQVAGRLERQQASGIGDALADAAGLDLIG